MIGEDPLVEWLDASLEEMRAKSFRHEDVLHSALAASVGGRVAFNSVTSHMAVNEATRRKDRCHTIGVNSDLLIEVSHKDEIVAISTNVGDQCFEICDEDLSWVGVRAPLKPEHVALLGVCCSMAGRASFLGDLLDGENDESFVAATHEVKATPASVRVREFAANAANEVIDGTSHGTARLMVAIQNYLACTSSNLGMVPDLAFVGV